MIDVKKIREKAVSYDSETEWSEDADFKGIVQCAFVDGARWVQKEFINSLWHDADEEPTRKTFCLGIYEEFSEVVIFRYPIANSSWKDYVRISSLEKWCYLEDVLPKGRR